MGLVWSGAPQTNAGTYPVTVTINDPSYQGSANGTFTIQPAPATISLGNLVQTYTGLPLSPLVSTLPAGLAYSLAGAPQSQAGSYAVTATITAPNYSGSAVNAFTIGKAQQAQVLVNAPLSARYLEAGLSIYAFGGSGTGGFTYSAGNSTACTVDSITGALTITQAAASVCLPPNGQQTIITWKPSVCRQRSSSIRACNCPSPSPRPYASSIFPRAAR